MSQVQVLRLNMINDHAEGTAKLPGNPAELQDQWKQCLAELEKELPWQTIQTWFLPVVPVAFAGNILVLRVPSRFFLDWMETNYGPQLQLCLARVFGENVQLDFLVAPAGNEAPEPAAPEEPDHLPNTDGKPSLQSEVPTDDRYTFANFLSGAENEFACKAVLHVAQNPGKANFNPLVIHGGIGSGKSHLLHALGNYFRENYPDKRTALYGSERYVHEYVFSLQNDRINQFTASFMSLEVFLLDDVHTLFNKSKSQEGMLFILSELVKKGTQVVVTCNEPPNQLRDFNPRLISFLQKGLIVDIPPCEYATREKIIRHHFERHGLSLNEKIIHYLSEHLGSNLHYLHAVLVRLVAQISLLGKSLSLNDVIYVVSQMCPQEGGECGPGGSRQAVGIDQIVNATALFYGVPVDILLGVSRKKKVMNARQIAIYLCRELTGESLTSIGYHFSHLHHSSVLYSYNKVGQALLRNAKLKSEIQKIKAML